MEEKALFKTWLLFLFLGLTFHVVFYFHNKSTIINISYWSISLLALIIIQQFINNPINNSRFSLSIYPILMIISLYLLKSTIAPYIHFSLDNYFYYFEYSNFYSLYINYINKLIGKDEAMLLFSSLYLTFNISFILFIIYYLFNSPITTLRRVYNGLFTLCGIILLLHCLLPTKTIFIAINSDNPIIYFNNLILSYSNMNKINFISLEASLSLFIGLTILRTNKYLGSVYLIFSLFLISALLYLKVAYITDIIIGILLTLFIFFGINRGFKHNRTSLNM